MSAPRVEGGLTRGAAMYLRALAERYNLSPDFTSQNLPEGERESLVAQSSANKPLVPETPFFDLDRQLALWHPEQVCALLLSLPEQERRRCWCFVEGAMADALKEKTPFAPLPPWSTELSLSYFRKRFFAHLGFGHLRPFVLLAPTPFDGLLELAPQSLVDLTDLMALHTLFTPLKRMIERDKREHLKAALRGAANSKLLHSYMRHLQSDINEQTTSITAVQFPLDQWNWNVESFGPLLRQFGLFCLSQLLKGLEADFLEHIFRKLDLPTSTQLRFLLKEQTPKRPNAEQIADTLQRLAAKASDFISSHHPHSQDAEGPRTSH